jgi:hypothetical protein
MHVANSHSHSHVAGARRLASRRCRARSEGRTYVIAQTINPDRSCLRAHASHGATSTSCSTSSPDFPPLSRWQSLALLHRGLDWLRQPTKSSRRNWTCDPLASSRSHACIAQTDSLTQNATPTAVDLAQLRNAAGGKCSRRRRYPCRCQSSRRGRGRSSGASPRTYGRLSTRCCLWDRSWARDA